MTNARDVEVEPITLYLETQTFGPSLHVGLLLRENLLRFYGPAIVEETLKRIAEKAATKFMEVHGAEVLAKMSPEAVSGALSIAAAERVAHAVDGVRQAINDKPRPVTHVHVTNHSSIF